MTLAFKLSMPYVNSWNGKWSGEAKNYVIVRNLGASKKATEKAEQILKTGSYSYHFGDGWVAGIDVSRVESSNKASSLRKQSDGFCGYDWMVDSIIENGEIRVK